MDAISFVLGVKASDLRGFSLKDLIFNDGSENSAQNNREAWVELVMHTNGGEERFEWNMDRLRAKAAKKTATRQAAKAKRDALKAKKAAKQKRLSEKAAKRAYPERGSLGNLQCNLRRHSRTH